MREKPTDPGFSHCVWCTECGRHHGPLYRCPTYDEFDLMQLEVAESKIRFNATQCEKTAAFLKIFGVYP